MISSDALVWAIVKNYNCSHIYLMLDEENAILMLDIAALVARGFGTIRRI